jgi:hypothetical protein
MSAAGREVQVALRFQPGVNVAIPVGYQLWEDSNRHHLRARLRTAVRRGEVESAGDWRVSKGGAASVLVKPLQVRRQRSAARIAMVVVAAATAAGVGALVWHSRYVLMSFLLMLAGIVLLVLGITRRSGNRAGGCSCVIHGLKGCKG